LSLRKKSKVEQEYLQEQLPQHVIENISENKRLEVRQRLKGKISMIASVVAAVIVWWIVSETILPDVPTPLETAKWSMVTFTDPAYYNSIIASMTRVYSGFILGMVMGTFLGLMMGWKRRVKNWTFPSEELLRHIPPVSWVPLTIIIMASLTPAIILVIFIGTFFATALNSMLGVESIEQSTFRAAICLGANQRQIFRHILLPGALPAILNGMVLGMGLAWMSVVAGEMIAGDYGIGYMAWQAYNLVRFPEIILAMLTIGGIAYGSSEIIRLIVNRFLRWRKVYA
jgi:NitT/TauT family transport system permease protein